MAEKSIHVQFKDGFKGELIAPNDKVNIGVEKGTLAPYDMLFGGLASCMYATFLEIAEKKRIHFDSADIEVTGEKRTEIPTTLKWVNVKVTIKNAEKEKGLIKAMEIAANYCSIYQTISKVAEMSWDIEFE
ncbi:OsmC family protein [Vallitalea pronyensis]|uniref:OsmC family protein n=1 Tax=Vallitalea pronyensis TaxID=1348613 RepID=A0A8J8SID1_9FIRM|nr:OsmC family protein [Vallitalea pronyensis]QUI24388.1 OsmC family protein [Vallitalea pronyensis]